MTLWWFPTALKRKSKCPSWLEADLIWSCRPCRTHLKPCSLGLGQLPKCGHQPLIHWFFPPGMPTSHLMDPHSSLRTQILLELRPWVSRSSLPPPHHHCEFHCTILFAHLIMAFLCWALSSVRIETMIVSYTAVYTCTPVYTCTHYSVW